MRPTARTLAYCRKQNWMAGVVERFNRHTNRSNDLFGCIDIIVCDGPGRGVIGVQACRGGDHATRREKALEEPRLATWLATGSRFEVWSWAKQGPRGKRKLWTLRRETIDASMLVKVDKPAENG